MGQTGSSLPSSLPELALHCLRVADHSPASGQLEPFFDYLIGIESPDHPFDAEPGTGAPQGHGRGLVGLSPAALGRILEDNEGKKVGLRVYNAKSQRIREPTSSDQQPKPSLLGLSLRACNPVNALESVYHVLDVLEGSPAEMAGLVPWGDYVLAWSGGPLHSESDFYNLIEAHVDKPLRLFVYNSDLDNLREVVLYPTRQWGGEGLVGCGIGYGLLHRIPRPETPPAGGAIAADGYFGPDSTRIAQRPDGGIPA
ncbi:GRASP55/65 PDZ-like domain-containing protein [Dioszegia hungarica]|uniref:GRASP55/65 PDZ-like domain-containing protein n=1 Tax=Dioszegia hungarica TaxID=4972 RepID=A0AA38HEQ5_9TREE|nr:GRASP55/65 PDZ-like domain-containing protein [Dioszegia hungarica]KAI9638990.1 GRASP55/65 PDZ-like domain-containing protein [Dioszegia hungarica]